MSETGGIGKMTRGQIKRAENRKVDQKRKDREAKQFAPGQKRHRNDLVVNQELGKVKIEEVEVVVKEEQSIAVVKEEVDLGLYIMEQADDADEVVTPLSDSGLNQAEVPLEPVLQIEPASSALTSETNISELVVANTVASAAQVLPNVSKRETKKPRPKGHIKFDSFETMQKFLKAKQNVKGNPFRGKTVSFETLCIETLETTSLSYVPEFKKYTKLICKLLERFGGHLRHVTLEQENPIFAAYNISTPLQLFKTLESYLPYIPNITSLTLSGSFDSYGSCNTKEYMKDKSLPLLKNLKNLDFGFKHSAIQNGILKKSPRLTSLKSQVNLEKSAERIEKLELKELKLVYNKSSDIKSLNRVHHRLEKLEFDITEKNTTRGMFFVHPKKSVDVMHLSKLLPALNQFPKLCELKLKGVIVMEKKKTVEKNLSVGTLRLGLSFISRTTNKTDYSWKGIVEDVFQTKGLYFWIISNFPNIHFLKIEDMKYAPDSSTEVNESTVYDSDIWTEFKSLEAVSMRYGTSTSLVEDKDGSNKSDAYTYWTWTRDNYRKFHECNSNPDFQAETVK